MSSNNRNHSLKGNLLALSLIIWSIVGLLFCPYAKAFDPETDPRVLAVEDPSVRTFVLAKCLWDIGVLDTKAAGIAMSKPVRAGHITIDESQRLIIMTELLQATYEGELNTKPDFKACGGIADALARTEYTNK